MRRFVMAAAAGSMLALLATGTTFASHCFVTSKPEGVGQQIVILLNPQTDQPTFVGTNAAGRLTGGFADIYLDLDQSGTLTDADVQVEDDVFLLSNHSFKPNPAQGFPAVLPSVQSHDPAGADKGVDG